MKKIIIAVILLFIAFSASAQLHADLRVGTTASSFGDRHLKMGIRAGAGVEYLFSDIIRKSKCSTDFKRNDFLKKNEAYPLGALRSLKFAYRKLRISLFVELAV